MSLPTLPSPVLATIIAHGQLELRDIASLRLVDRACNAALTSRELCRFLLRHFFPFAQETHSGGCDNQAFNAVCRRLQRVRESKWALNWEVTFPTTLISGLDDDDEAFPPEGFRLMDTDSDEGYFLTAYVEDHLESVRITVRNLVTGQDVTISVPREELAGIYMAAGKVLMVYDREKAGGGSMLIFADCRSDGNGRIIWTVSVSTSVFHGIPDSRTAAGAKRLQPVFNEHYVAFLNSFDTSGNSRINILRPHSSDSDASTEFHVCPLRFSPSTLISIKPDTPGKHLLVSERFPHHKNLHRVVLVDALSGASISAYPFNVSPQYALSPSRDMHAFFSPSGTELVVWGSVRSAEYRDGGVLGQLMVFPLTTTGGTIRYLGAPALTGKEPPSSMSERATVKTYFSPDLSIVYYGTTAVGFPSLNLDIPAAGSGGLANNLNHRPPAWKSTLTTSPGTQVEIGSSWITTEHADPGNSSVTVELMRIADPKPFAPEPRYEDSVSKRSSWVLGSTAPGSSSASVFGFGMQAPMGAQVAQVDAAELAMRLKEMERERAKEGGVKRRSWEQKKRTWKEKLFSAWR